MRNLAALPGFVLWVAGVLLTLARLLSPLLASWLSGPLDGPQNKTTVFIQIAAATLGAGACLLSSFTKMSVWNGRVRLAWSCIGASAVFFALGWATFLLSGSTVSDGATLGDLWWVFQQPLLWIGLFLLAWRGRGLGMIRLLADNLIIAMSMLVLSWSLVLQQRVWSQQLSPLSKIIAVYYPVFDIAHLFCALMLIAGRRERPGFTLAARYLLAGIAALILSDSVTSYFLTSRASQLIWFDIAALWSYLLMGIAALVHARSSLGVTVEPSVETATEIPTEVPSENPVESPDESPLERLASLPQHLPTLLTQPSPRDLKVARWHQNLMLWLPCFATLAVSGVLIGQEMQAANLATVQRLLPLLSLLLAIVARQMIALWDNLQLSYRLRSTNASLEINVAERTRHLATLHGITSTLNTSLDRPTVLRVALGKIVAAVNADAGGIWLRDTRRDIYSENAPDEEWSLVHWQGLDENPAMASLLRDLAITSAQVGESQADLRLSPALRDSLECGGAPPANRLVMVPVRWQGHLLGVIALVRNEGAFTDEDRALVESVALEAGTALQNARLYAEAAHRADRDSVTELFNHRAIQEQLGAMLARCQRTQAPFSLVMMDLNNFKFFNDTYGHPVGDDVLRAVARSLRDSCRASDVLGRYGGDEFIILLPDTDASGTLEMCQRIKVTLDARHFEPIPGTQLPIAISFGWAAYPHDGDSVHDLLAHADSNLYNHKRGGASYLSQSAKAISESQTESRKELKRLKNRAFGGSFSVLDALVTAIDNKDHYTRHHSEEVTYFSLLVARELGYSPAQLAAVRISGLLHDVGKIAVPDDILRHPGKLGREEWEIMQQHPVFGALIVKDVPHLEPVLAGIRHHHEKWDGSGYPEQLEGENIPEMGRLLALADCYSALTTDRPYRKGWPPEVALDEIERGKGSHFDPKLCDVFLRVMRQELLHEDEIDDYGQLISAQFEVQAPEVSFDFSFKTTSLDLLQP